MCLSPITSAAAGKRTEFICAWIIKPPFTTPGRRKDAQASYVIQLRHEGPGGCREIRSRGRRGGASRSYPRVPWTDFLSDSFRASKMSKRGEGLGLGIRWHPPRRAAGRVRGDGSGQWRRFAVSRAGEGVDGRRGGLGKAPEEEEGGGVGAPSWQERSVGPGCGARGRTEPVRAPRARLRSGALAGLPLQPR